MAKALTDTIIDSILYKAGEEIPDFGSIVVVSPKNGMGQRDYEGLAKDFSKLPTYCGSGSTFMALDTGEIYDYHAPTKKWYLL